MSESKRVPSASVITVYIMEYLYDQTEQGALSLDHKLQGRTVKDLIYDMITRSDNTATNIFIDHIGMEKLNAFFKEKGYSDTLIERKMLDKEAMASGKDNYTSIKDVMSFLEKLYYNKEAYPYSEMLAIMKEQQVKTKIQAGIPDEAQVANKTGELSNVENDIGIVFTNEGDFAIAFLCSSLSDTNEARSFIKQCSNEIYTSFITQKGGN